MAPHRPWHRSAQLNGCLVARCSLPAAAPAGAAHTSTSWPHPACVILRCSEHTAAADFSLSLLLDPTLRTAPPLHVPSQSSVDCFLSCCKDLLWTLYRQEAGEASGPPPPPHRRSAPPPAVPACAAAAVGEAPPERLQHQAFMPEEGIGGMAAAAAGCLPARPAPAAAMRAPPRAPLPASCHFLPAWWQWLGLQGG